MNQPNAPAGDSWAAAPREWFALRDIFRGPGLAVDGGKWLTGLLPTLLGLVAYLVLAELIPDVSSIRDAHPTIHLALRLVGGVIFCYAFAFAVSGVAYRVRGEVLDNKVRSWSDVIDFWLRRRWTLLLPPLVLLFFTAAGLSVAGAIGLVGLIPGGIGQAAWAVLFVLAIPFALYAAAFLLVLVLGSFVYPAIVAMKEEEVFDVVHDMFDIVRNRGPLLLLCMGVTALFLAATALIVWLATNLTLGIGDLCMGLSASEGVAALKAGAPFFHEPYVAGWLTCLWTNDALVAGSFAANAFGFMLSAVSLLYLGYAVALYSSCSAMTYLAMADPYEIEDLMERVREPEGGSRHVHDPAAAAADRTPSQPPPLPSSRHVHGPAAAAAAAMAAAAAAATDTLAEDDEGAEEAEEEPKRPVRPRKAAAKKKTVRKVAAAPPKRAVRKAAAKKKARTTAGAKKTRNTRVTRKARKAR